MPTSRPQVYGLRQDPPHTRILRKLAKELVKPLSIIHQQFWLTGEVPADWKTMTAGEGLVAQTKEAVTSLEVPKEITFPRLSVFPQLPAGGPVQRLSAL